MIKYSTLVNDCKKRGLKNIDKFLKKQPAVFMV